MGIHAIQYFAYTDIKHVQISGLSSPTFTMRTLVLFNVCLFTMCTLSSLQTTHSSLKYTQILLSNVMLL